MNQAAAISDSDWLRSPRTRPVSNSSDVPRLDGPPTWADALFVGNPTNPTGALHERDALLAAGRGRLLVVDEASMDATDEHESLIEPSMPNRLVVRSLSKTWGLAGLRVGYVVGDPALISRLAQAQPAWPISTAAALASIATTNARARADASARYADLGTSRDQLASADRQPSASLPPIWQSPACSPTRPGLRPT